MRAAVTILCLLAAALSDAPAGFSWHTVASARASFLVPTGWTARDEESGKALAVFVTESADVGLTVNVYRDDPNAPATVKAHLDAMASAHGVKLTSSTNGPFQVLGCKFDAPRKPDGVPMRSAVMGIANPHTRTSYLLLFEAPVSRWDDAWAKGKVMLDHLALDPEL